MKKTMIQGRLTLSQAANRLLQRRLANAESALAGQQNAGRIMMEALGRQRQLLEAYGIEADYDFDTSVDEQYSWPAPA